ncbi:MAG TPA: MBL fold metallo-hydrolase [Thermofilum sp.]|nr:MBL fold metallo-hydrolase [Thermofilum sp.]
MVKFLRITVLVDNEPADGLRNEWGWSALLETDKWRALFDADTDPAVLRNNSKRLRVDWNLDFGFLSHWHGDHYGGYEYVGKVSPGLNIYVPPGNGKILGDWGLNHVVVDEPVSIAEDAWSSGPMGRVEEQALGVLVKGLGLVVVVGCSHPGVDVLASKLSEIVGEEVYMVIGGFHEPSKETLDRIASISKLVCPAHCTASRAKEYLELKYPEKTRSVKTGSIFTVGKEE